ncbi:aldehyde dehydrogenase family protein [Mesorhizobium sp.]|uniref:aldehyde dehydrogenase family protein n=1 Tax=Mesorhizobium sp. TaxID=1871066 RepID=UPI00338E9334
MAPFSNPQSSPRSPASWRLRKRRLSGRWRRSSASTMRIRLSVRQTTRFTGSPPFHASNLRRVWRVAEALEYGMIGINTGRMSSEAAPFGGMKQSGIGREGSRHGLEDYLEMKYLCMGGI